MVDPMWMILGFLTGILTVLTTLQLHRYMNWKHTEWYAIGLVWIGWFMSFSIVFLIPLDVASSLHMSCLLVNSTSIENTIDCRDHSWAQFDQPTLVVIWKVLYWSTYILCWTAYPIVQSYVTAGDFTVVDKVVSAIKENVIFYLVALIIIIVLIVILAINGKLDFVGLYSVGIAAANAWGLFMLICLLGYGLVEIPKRIWRHANRNLTLKYYQFQAVSLREENDKAQRELDSTLRLIRKYDEKIADYDPLRPFIDTIISKCPEQFKQILSGEGDAELTYEKLVSLHIRIIKAQHEATRAKIVYENLLHNAFQLEDIIKSKNNPNHVVEWSFKPRRQHFLRRQFDVLEWVWRSYLETFSLRCMCIICSLMSASVVFSEVFFNISPDLSIFALLLNKPQHLTFTLHAFFVFVPVCYIAFCAYWSLFKLRLFNYYSLFPHQQSDSNSLLFSASYLCRLTAPLAYNYLLMIWNKSSAFSKVIRTMELAPFLGSTYNVYFPIVLILFCVVNLFNLYTKFVTKCCFKRFQRFVFDEDFNDAQIEHGREIIKHEREVRQKLSTSPPVSPPSSKYSKETVINIGNERSQTNSTTSLLSSSSSPTLTIHDAIEYDRYDDYRSVHNNSQSSFSSYSVPKSASFSSTKVSLANSNVLANKLSVPGLGKVFSGPKKNTNDPNSDKTSLLNKNERKHYRD